MRKIFCIIILNFALLGCGPSRAKINAPVEDVVKTIVSEILMINPQIKNQSYLVHDLGADELDVVEIAIALEFQYDIIITDQEMENWHSVNDIIQMTNEKLSK